MKFAKAWVVVASLTTAFGITTAHADPKEGDPCERSGDVVQLGGGVGAKVFTCLGDKLAHTNTVGAKQFGIEAALSDGRVYNVVTLAGQSARSAVITNRSYDEFGKGADGKDATFTGPYSTNVWMKMTPTLAQTGEIALSINASVSETVSMDAYEFGEVKVRTPEVRSYGLNRTLKLQDGIPQVIPFGPLTMKLTVVGIAGT